MEVAVPTQNPETSEGLPVWFDVPKGHPDRMSEVLARAHRAEAEAVRRAQVPDLGGVVHDRCEDKTAYKTELWELQRRLRQAQGRLAGSDRSLLVLFAGAVKAGKGGIVRRLLGKLDARSARAHALRRERPGRTSPHFLRRYWPLVPPRGRLCVLDRSWYERLIDDRLDGHLSVGELGQAAREICDFERCLAANGIILAKVYLHLTLAAQNRRLGAEGSELETAWTLHVAAAQEAIRLTDREHARWLLVGADCKRAARLAALRGVLAQLEQLE